MSGTRTGRPVISKEAYEQATEAWLAARSAMGAANEQAKAAEAALYAAEEALAEQEAYPGIAAYQHAEVGQDQCRIGINCPVHSDFRHDQW